MKEIDKSKPVMVTGATGYVAEWLVKLLLDQGMTVHATVRNPMNKEKLSVLEKLAEEADGTIKFFKADLLHPHSFKEAMEGCELVYHTASPFFLDVVDPKEELVEPALRGTQNVLEQANETESVQRVVLTSSVAAIYGDNIDLKKSVTGKFTEKDWNTTSSLTHGAYMYSKILAEREAWKIYDAQDRWDLVVINPSFVMGPAIDPKHVTSESFKLIKKMGNGTFKSGLPSLACGVVDVRDVAIAHFRAGIFTGVEGRYIVSGHDASLLKMSTELIPVYGDSYPLPTKLVPKWLLWFLGPMMDKSLSRRFIRKNIGLRCIMDNTKSKDDLKMIYRPMHETMQEMFQQLIDHQLLK
ncbi:NAD-dependent epimerase/dehydratase family protein [Halosquirtibacter xylanolyticus]|uniref:NAD-dependent epimerase/dehydratase family protein n=1 Tax=Halosquirtibacter xylanolyticus TaxID=3374599 RepID=UPI00374A41F0|nr:NAD-dependent epimerase/dehydratase family protein [Prolixibacteraceae bacterium]